MKPMPDQREGRVSDVGTSDDDDAEDRENNRHANPPQPILCGFECGDEPHKTSRNQPDANQQRDRSDPSERMADQQHPRNHTQHSEHGEQSPVLRLATQCSDELDDAVDKNEYPDDHRQRRQAVARLRDHDDSGHDAHKPISSASHRPQVSSRSSLGLRDVSDTSTSWMTTNG